jgi:DNA-directed RNA polymerase specialized sigma subunit
MSIPEDMTMTMPHPLSLQLQTVEYQMQPLPQIRRKRKTPEEALEAEQRALKRKRTPKLTINDKVKIIYLHKHELKSYTEIGSVFRCTKSTISGIIKNSNEILDKASKMSKLEFFASN